MPIDFINHYLDDFIFALPLSQASSGDIQHFNTKYNTITDTLGIPRADAKDATGTCITILGIEIDSIQMVARLPTEKLNKAKHVTAIALSQSTITLELAESLAGFLAFCATVTQLGRVYMRYIWTFVAAYPHNAAKSMKRRIPAIVRADLLWWHTLLPSFNGIRFLDETARKVIHICISTHDFGIDF